MDWQQGTYYVIHFSSYHNDESKEEDVICQDRKEIIKEIEQKQQIHDKTHWESEELRYSVWEVSARKIEIKKQSILKIED